MKPAHILVVDDDRLNRIKLSTHLEEAGYTVSTAADGALALQLLGDEEFDAVLLDLLMPVLDGFEVLQKMRQHTRLAKIPVIVISGEEGLESVVRCIEMGAADYLPKPFNGVLLRARMNACLEQKRAHDREAKLYSELEQRYLELQNLHETIRDQAEQLRELSIRDPLTGLYNRRHFDEQAARALSQSQRYCQPMCVMIGDIDFFKKINDGYSHATGDEVLRQVGALLASNTRESDIVARYGGEEFVVALPQTSLSQARVLCEKLRSLIEDHPWHQLHADLRVTMSMGLCAETSLGPLEKMVANADDWLYRAKQGGRNRVEPTGPQQGAS